MYKAGHSNALPATQASGAPVAAEVRLWVGNWRKRDTRADLRAWDDLALASSEPNPFFESWYLLPSLRALDPHGSVRLAVLGLQGQLLGLIPLRWEPYYYGKPLPHWQVWCHENAFLGQPLVARGFEQLFWHELLGWLDRHAWRFSELRAHQRERHLAGEEFVISEPAPDRRLWIDVVLVARMMDQTERFCGRQEALFLDQCIVEPFRKRWHAGDV